MRSLTFLTSSIGSLSRREPLWRCSSRRTILWGVLCLTGLNVSPALGVDKSQTNQLKLYAHSRIIDANQYQCFVKIINKENPHWNPLSRNKSHFGIGQMRSQWYRNLDAYRQIDATLNYITKRYQSPCKAWAFHQVKGWY